jgi:hypothetical protein
MSDTPETDEACGFASYYDKLQGKIRGVVAADFARKLERERDEAREAFVIATDQMVIAQSNLREANKERDEARKQSAKFRDIAERAVKIGLSK